MSKQQLKALAETIRAKRFEDAVQQASDFLANDGDNVQALVFYGFALDKLGRLDEAVAAYSRAATLKPGDTQAWQGLVQVHEQQGAGALLAYRHAATQLAAVYRDAGDLYKCQVAVDRFTDHARKVASPLQLVDALAMILPGSPVYDALEGRVPRPATTYETLATAVEADEAVRIARLVDERRTRLGARLVEVARTARDEVFSTSPLAGLYAAVIDWTSDDDVRRVYEEKLLAYRLERLAAFSGTRQDDEREAVRTMARGMVIIDHAFQPAWDVCVEWEDVKAVGGYDASLLWQYQAHFPSSPLGRALAAFLTSDLSPFAQPGVGEGEGKAKGKQGEQKSKGKGKGKQGKGRQGVEPAETAEETVTKTEGTEADTKTDETEHLPSTDDERLALLREGAKESLLASRLLGAWYDDTGAHVAAIGAMRDAFKTLDGMRTRTGLALNNTHDALAGVLGAALVAHESPKHHAEARRLFEGVLAHDATSTRALVGLAHIAQEAVDYTAAADYFARALAHDASDARVQSDGAWVHVLLGNYGQAQPALESVLPRLQDEAQSTSKTKTAIRARKQLALAQYRLGVCVWERDTSRAARKNRSGAYAHFVAALRNDLVLAPAYTSLGVYYADYARDHKRAFTLFLKALELSDAELEAGRRLVAVFARRRDWDSVALVAQRVIDSGRATPPWGSRRPSASWPFAARGTAQLHAKEYGAAMMSFRMATRLGGGGGQGGHGGHDYHASIALAETYLRARMHHSALRAIEQATPPPGTDTWHTDYLLANVHRGLGAFEPALRLYDKILEDHPEGGVVVARLHALTESAEADVKIGLFGEAAHTAASALVSASASASASLHATRGFWEAVAGACSIFSTVQGHVRVFPVAAVAALLADDASFAYLQDLDAVGTKILRAEAVAPDDARGVGLVRVLHATILAHKRALACVAATDRDALATAHYNLGWAEYRAHACLPDTLRGTLTGFLRSAIRSFKRSIELAPRRRAAMNALGVATSSVHARVAQHAFVRALFLRGARAPVWANLGTLALLHDDAELANAAFAEGQAGDPEYAASWLGQGFVAQQCGQRGEARSLFRHAVDLSDASALVARQQYAIAEFDAQSDAVEFDTADQGRSLIALEQVTRQRPDARAYMHLLALFRERASDTSTVDLLEAICAELEAEFEATESVDALQCVAISKADLARAYVARALDGDYAKAIASADMALLLVEGDDDARRIRMSARLAAGLAKFSSDDVDGAVAEFDALMAGDDADPDVVCLAAQVLWSSGVDAHRARAQDALFSVVEAHPDHTHSVLLLGVMALLAGDADSADAVAAELAAVQLDARSSVTAADHAQVAAVQQALAPTAADALYATQRDLVLRPHLPHAWTSLADLAADVDDEAESEQHAADMALRLARAQLPPRGDLHADDLALAYTRTGRAADAQVAIVAAPWLLAGWEALAEVVAA